MEDFWSKVCRDSSCSETGESHFCYDFKFLKDPSSCINHLMIIFFDVLLLTMLSFIMIMKSSSRPFWSQVRYSNLQLFSAITNASIGLLHLCLGIWFLVENLRKTHQVFPLNWWLQELFQGFTFLLVSLTISLQIKQLSRAWLWLFSILIFFVSGVLCALSISYAIGNRELSLKEALDVVSFLGTALLLLCTCKVTKSEEIVESLYAPLNGQFNEADHVTPFAKAGFFSNMSFWWLNPLMKRGQDKTLQDEDIPKLRASDRADSCYLSFVEELNRQRQHDGSSDSSILWTIISCYRKEIFVTGFYALLKTLTLSCGPILLNAFILVVEGNGSFKYEGYVLAISLFFIKVLECLSQRQWYFQSRLVGMKVRSLLTAAIYKKTLSLSNSARLIHSSGEIMNYMTVDAYRIGEFPFWFHKTWTTILQICLALVILFHAIGVATIVSLLVIVITVLCNSPLAKLQHKFQSKLMVAQDARLKASSEALANMKVLKLIFLFWTSPMLVSTASFLACYFLNVPLHASNVFTFVATLRLVQYPITDIADVIGVIIQAKVAFARIVEFLEAPELQSATGEKVAICGEVGSGKSTLLATTLGEVQYLNQMKGYILFFGTSLSQFVYLVCLILQNSWMAANIDNPGVRTLQLILVYFLIGASSLCFLLIRCLLGVSMGLQSSKYLFLQLMNSLFRAPVSFYDFV